MAPSEYFQLTDVQRHVLIHHWNEEQKAEERRNKQLAKRRRR
jgi:hypothetical protein